MQRDGFLSSEKLDDLAAWLYSLCVCVCVSQAPSQQT